MPIIERPRQDAPLTQGDILSGVSLYATKGSWEEKGGVAAAATFELCLVLSRPCVAAHKKYLVVAGVAKYPDSVPKGLDNFNKVLDFLSSARDGLGSPDVFYLGQLPLRSGRYCARFDALHTIDIPDDPEGRARFLSARRIATLSPDFARDLHLRLFASFASLGFHDIAWLSTEDLHWLVTQGRADLTAAEQATLQQQALQASRAAEGTQFRDADLVNAQRRLEQLRQQVTPYEEELARRQKQS
jgi:hypothetical protein